MNPSISLLAALALVASCATAPGQDAAPTPAAQVNPGSKIQIPAPPQAGAGVAANEKPKGPPPTKAILDDLTKRLDDDDFKTREHAQLELTRLAHDHPQATFDAVLEKYVYSFAPEARYRLRAILYGAKQAEFMGAPRGFVGIQMLPSIARGPAGELTYAIQVARVVEGSAAERHGLKLMDQILEIDGIKFDTPNDASEKFANYVMSKPSGEEVELTIRRNNQDRKVKLTLGQRPPDLSTDPRLQSQFQDSFKTWLDENSARIRAKK